MGTELETMEGEILEGVLVEDEELELSMIQDDVDWHEPCGHFPHRRPVPGGSVRRLQVLHQLTRPDPQRTQTSLGVGCTTPTERTRAMDTIYTLFRLGDYVGAYRDRETAQADAQRHAERRDELAAGRQVIWDQDTVPGRKTRWVMHAGDEWIGYHVTEDQLR